MRMIKRELNAHKLVFCKMNAPHCHKEVTHIPSDVCRVRCGVKHFNNGRHQQVEVVIKTGSTQLQRTQHLESGRGRREGRMKGREQRGPDSPSE